jgi:hypothetical protein
MVSDVQIVTFSKWQKVQRLKKGLMTFEQCHFALFKRPYPLKNYRKNNFYQNNIYNKKYIFILNIYNKYLNVLK